MPIGPISESTIENLISNRIFRHVLLINLECWTQAILLSQMLGPTQFYKAISKYAQKTNNADPFFTLLLINNGLAQKTLELNPNILVNWPKHIAYLLQNSHLCANKHDLADFLNELSKQITNKISYMAGLFIKLIAGNPVIPLSQIWTFHEKSIRTIILAECIHQFWNKFYPTPEQAKVNLLEIYYEKAYIFYANNQLSHVFFHIKYHKRQEIH